MPIFVVCPGCKKQFQVSDQFAGRTGPCPNCKTPIRIPKLEEQVIIHGPEEAQPPGKSRTGRPTPKPVARKDAQFQPVVAVGIVAAVLVVAVVTFAARGLLVEWWLARAVGLLLVSPPLVLGAYFVLRDDEFEPYRGRELYIRTGSVALVYAVLWAVFGYVETTFLTGEVWQWLVVAPPFVVVGAFAPLAALDFEFGAGVFHYSFYVLVTVVLRWLAGLGWIWEAGLPIE